jgi:hypothetical protein
MSIPTPLEFYWRYRDLDVPLANGLRVYGLDVHEYRNARNYFKHKPDEKVATNDHDIIAGMTRGWGPLYAKLTHPKNLVKRVGAYGLVVQGGYRYDPSPGNGQPKGAQATPTETEARRDYYTEEIDDWRDLLRVFDGKGSPRHIAQALRLAQMYGLLGVKSTAEADMREWCVNLIGLDCSGFVGNYLRHCGVTFAGYSLYALPELLPDYFSPPSARLAKLEQVRACDVITLGDAHVQIIDKVESFERDDTGEVVKALVWVCESAGGCTEGAWQTRGRSKVWVDDVHTDGLSYTQYVLTSPRRGAFQMYRGKGWEHSRNWDSTAGRHRETDNIFINRLM